MIKLQYPSIEAIQSSKGRVLIIRFLRDHLGNLLVLSSLTAINAAAAFLALSTINGSDTKGFSFIVIAQAALLIATLVGCAAMIQSFSARLGANFVHYMRVNFSKTLLKHSYSPGSRNSGHGLSAFINDIAELAPLAVTAPQVVYNLLFAFVAIGYLFYISTPLAALVMLELAVLTTFSVVLRRWKVGQLQCLIHRWQNSIEFNLKIGPITA